MEYISLRIHQIWGWYFFRKCSKLNLNSENSKKNSENTFRFWDKSIWKCCNKLPQLRREYLSPAVNGLTYSPKIFPYFSERRFKPELPSNGLISMVEVLWSSFEQCFGQFTMLLLTGSFENGLFRHLSDHVFRSP